jgi:uncharacterized ferredoxin-like protein
MPTVSGTEVERQATQTVAQLMLTAARTAPKAGGEDDILTALVWGEDKDRLADTMEKLGEELGMSEMFSMNATNVRTSEYVLLIGARACKRFRNLNCGACGYNTCEEFEKAKKKEGKTFKGPQCHLKVLDLGIALGSAAKVASILNIDNRIMYTVGAAARRLKILAEADAVTGIPISAKGKSIYYDRKEKMPDTQRKS